MEVSALREFLSDTEWGVLDYLLIDLPPGTDRLPNLIDLLPTLGGTVVVTIPSSVSQLVVKKSLTMAKKLPQHAGRGHRRKYGGIRLRRLRKN